MDFEIITIFPDLIEAVAPYGVVGRARMHPSGDNVGASCAQSAGASSGRQSGSYRLRCWNPRDFTFDNYRRVDDRPYGGGPGMVMLAEPLLRCVQAIRETRAAEGLPDLPLIHLSPQGQPFSQARARQMAATPGAILLCGRYEAIDQRFLDAMVDEEISMGDFVVSGGELPAMLVLDAVVRLLPGVLNDGASAEQDSFENGLLDCPHYTRPEQLSGLPRDVAPGVPPVLLSGNHREIDRWRLERSREATAKKRPDLLARAPLDTSRKKA
ncbi:MAG: tRNA (guanosine(37)-N1)-methyltransferase TrmD [Lautropia sp.]|nr:tRNA (guanosine(37)-N1)-methyltransferase TrmD [Lautropia sp.]